MTSVLITVFSLKPEACIEVPRHSPPSRLYYCKLRAISSFVKRRIEMLPVSRSQSSKFEISDSNIFSKPEAG